MLKLDQVASAVWRQLSRVSGAITQVPDDRRLYEAPEERPEVSSSLDLLDQEPIKLAPHSPDLLPRRLSLVHQNLTSLHYGLVNLHCLWITTLDLSHNEFQDVDFIVFFEALDTLILDHNLLHGAVVFPRVSTLTTLWINFNQLDSLSPFIERLSLSFPALAYLSMMGNRAAPSYVNGGNFHEYILYRMHVVSRIKRLRYLDDRLVDADERRQAYTMHPEHAQIVDRAARSSKPHAPIESAVELPMDRWVQLIRHYCSVSGSGGGQVATEGHESDRCK